MITEISLKNFKCFSEEKTFTFSKINLLTGINGRGKSSLLQSMLLISQTFRKKNDPQQLLINEEWVQLGNFKDIKNSNSSENTIRFRFKLDDKIQNEIIFEYQQSHLVERIALLTDLYVDGQNMNVEMSSADTTNSTVKSEKSFLPLKSINTLQQFHRFHYISADRLGPVEFVNEINDTPESIQVGIKGENVINMLAYNGDSIHIDENRCVKGINALLKTQAIAWLSYILDGANLDVKKGDSILSMLLNSQNNTNLYKPINVGFGYSYILPLIVTGLIAKVGDIIVIENPEAHLHPRAQHLLTEFFIKVAEAGIQVFIESHSDHILNAMRLCSVKSDFSLNNNDISIIYFDENYNHFPITFDECGRLSTWPSGFFDQQEIALTQLFNLTKD